MRTTKLKLDRAILQGQIRAVRELAKTLPDIIRERVRSGLGLNGPLDGLSESYIKVRKRYASNLSSETAPRFSNLTATGQMLKGIIGEASGTIVRIFMRGKRTKELNGGKPRLTNNEIRKEVERTRPFFELTDKERRAAIDSATEIIKQEIRKAFK